MIDHSRTRIAKEALDAGVLAVLEHAASEGRRCPTNSEIAAQLSEHGIRTHIAASSIPGVLQRLIRQGFLTVRIYGNNWRDVVLHYGNHSGKATCPPPHGGQPHVILDKAERERRDRERDARTWKF